MLKHQQINTTRVEKSRPFEENGGHASGATSGSSPRVVWKRARLLKLQDKRAPQAYMCDNLSKPNERQLKKQQTTSPRPLPGPGPGVGFVKRPCRGNGDSAAEV